MERQCPIFVGLLEMGSNGYAYGEDNHQYLRMIEDIFIGKLAKEPQAWPQTLLINPKFIIKRDENACNQVQISYINQSSQMITALYQKGFKICFDLLRYCSDTSSLFWIAQLLK